MVVYNTELVEWRIKYRDKEIKPEFLSKIIKMGSRIYIGSACSEPLILTNQLVKNKLWKLNDVEILHFFTTSNQMLYCEDYPSKFRYNTLSIIGSPEMRNAINKGSSDFTPINSSEIGRLLNGDRYKIDVALVQVSPPDHNGYCSLGINVDVNRTIVNVAKVIVAVVNPNMPRTIGDSFIKFSKINYFIYDETPLLEYHPPEIFESTRKIVHYITKLIEDDSTLNFGFGRISYALPECVELLQKKNLAIYSEFLPETIIPLIEKGVINCSKNYYPHIMTSFIMGTKKFYDYVDDNPFFEFHPTDYICNVENIGKNHKLCSIYSAISVDLFGQATNHLGTDLYSGTGGEADFMRGSAISKGGKAIVALSSRSKDGKSRILPVLPPGLIALRAIDVHYVVTEWGIAHLHGKSIRERVLQMINIAHPKFRAELLRKAKEMHIIYEDQILPTLENGLIAVCPDLSWEFETKSKGIVNFRPIQLSDERMLQDLYYGLSEHDRIMRFLSPKKLFSHEETQKRIACDYHTSMVIVGVIGSEEEDQRVISSGSYYLNPETNLAETSVCVHEDYRGQGLARFMFNTLIQLAKNNGIAGLFGDVYIKNPAIIHVLKGIASNIVFKSVIDDENILEFQFYFSNRKPEAAK